MDWLPQATTAVRSAYGQTAGYLTLGNLVSISWVSIWVVICVLIFQDLSRDLVTIEPISTPEAFAKDGYTPEVASRRLHDALNKYAANAGTRMQSRKVASSEELPDFVVPKIDLSLNAMVASIRSALHYGSGQRITGEFIVHDKLQLRLRVDGQDVFGQFNDHNDPDQLLADAAAAVMEKIRPYLVASTLYESDPKSAADKADYIIDHLKASDVNVEWAYVLKGNYFIDQKQFVEAENVLRLAVHLNWGNAMAHNNLGVALKGEGRPDEAVAQYQRAIAIDPNFAIPHHNLGVVLHEKSNPDGAVAEYRLAIRIDPAYFDGHLSLGNIWYDQGKFDEARREYEAAVACERTDQQLAIAHHGLGLVFSNMPVPNIDEAIEHYRFAINVAPNYSPAHNNLGTLLLRRGKLDEAISEFQRALAIDPGYTVAKANLDDALQSKRLDQDSRTDQGKQANAPKRKP